MFLFNFFFPFFETFYYCLLWFIWVDLILYYFILLHVILLVLSYFIFSGLQLDFCESSQSDMYVPHTSRTAVDTLINTRQGMYDVILRYIVVILDCTFCTFTLLITCWLFVLYLFTYTHKKWNYLIVLLRIQLWNKLFQTNTNLILQFYLTKICTFFSWKRHSGKIRKKRKIVKTDFWSFSAWKYF